MSAVTAEFSDEVIARVLRAIEELNRASGGALLRYARVEVRPMSPAEPARMPDQETDHGR